MKMSTGDNIPGLQREEIVGIHSEIGMLNVAVQ